MVSMPSAWAHAGFSAPGAAGKQGYMREKNAKAGREKEQLRARSNGGEERVAGEKECKVNATALRSCTSGHIGSKNGGTTRASRVQGSHYPTAEVERFGLRCSS